MDMIFGKNTILAIGGKKINIENTECDINIKAGKDNCIKYNTYNIDIKVECGSDADFALKNAIGEVNEQKNKRLNQ